MARLRSASATSAGGIVVRSRDSRPEIVLGARRRVRGGRTWTLPKGTPDPGESIEETARREVTEETGLQVDIVGSLGSIEYSFVKAGVRIEKTVHYFLMQPRGGDLGLHDQEFEEVRWVDIEIQHDERGRPQVVLRDSAATLAAKLGLQQWDVSLSHTDTLAIAFVVALG